MRDFGGTGLALVLSLVASACGPAAGPGAPPAPPLAPEAPNRIRVSTAAPPTDAVAPRLALPGVMHIKSAGGHCATWVPNSPALRVVSFTRDAVVMDRSDPPNPYFPRGLHFRYVGKISADGDHIENGMQTVTFGLPPGSGLFHAAWGSAIDDVPGEDGPACAAWGAGQPQGPVAAPPPPPQEASAAVPADIEKSLPKDSASNAAIDDGFKRWSSTWMFDRYLPGSARATDRGLKGGTYVIRGMFTFVRGGGPLTIPFAAAFTNSSDGYRLSNLCYNDNTSGMTDCIDPSDAQGLERSAMQSRQFLGSIVVLGLAAAMSSESEVCERHSSFLGDTYYCH